MPRSGEQAEMKNVLVSAGDLSGERIAARFVQALHRKQPELRFFGMGGTAMAEAGVELIVDQRNLAVGGVLEAASSVGRLVRAWSRMVRAIREESPCLAVLVDSGGFNLPLARRFRRLCKGAPVLYYVAPQAWAWRPERVRVLAERTDRVAVILPFEHAFYASHGLEVEAVGHPILEQTESRGEPPSAEVRSAARTRLGLASSGPLVALYPGSRRSEIRYHASLFLDAFELLRKQDSRLRAAIALAPSLSRTAIDEVLAPRGAALREHVAVVSGASTDLARAADVAITKPGTTTLELMLHGCPMVVAGRVHPLTARMVRRTLQARSVALPNLIAEQDVVPECLQEEATPARIAAEAAALFEDASRRAQQEVFSVACVRLGTEGASERVAAIAEELLAPA